MDAVTKAAEALEKDEAMATLIARAWPPAAPGPMRLRIACVVLDAVGYPHGAPSSLGGSAMTVDADLTCPTCPGDGWTQAPWGLERCTCGGTGRRSPTLAEWDALRAERDRYGEALRQIRGLDAAIGPSRMREVARTALDREKESSKPGRFVYIEDEPWGTA